MLKCKIEILGFGKTYLRGISTTSSEFNFISGYIFLYILDDIINAKETNNMEQNINIHTNYTPALSQHQDLKNALLILLIVFWPNSHTDTGKRCSLLWSFSIIFFDIQKVPMHITKLMTRWFQNTPYTWELLNNEGAMAL